ncbi:hypothetical protein AB0I98_06765 [Streptomyces sp. NPDC050211]|uniref:hypothetical protein n=1 Tax=Streptomyces sp. NPDC050211 TaxID=3154932 RepID=UPI003419C5E7
MTSTLNSPRPTGFQQRLGDELESLAGLTSVAPEAEARPVPRRTRTVRLRLPLAVAGVAAGVTAAVALPVLSLPGQEARTIGSSAYAVTEERDGTLLLRLDRRDGLAGFQKALDELGVPATALEPSAACTEPWPERIPGASTGLLGPEKGDPPNSIRVDPDDLPDNGHLLLTTGFTSDGRLAVLAPWVVKDIPSCLPGSGEAVHLKSPPTKSLRSDQG